MRLWHALLVLALGVVGAGACNTEWHDLVSDRLEGGVRPIDPPPDTGVKPPDGSLPLDASPRVDSAMTEPDAALFVPVARCGTVACACDDGADNDEDGLTDGFDPECTGAYDQDEATFATGQPLRPGGCRDCFWDEDKGNGNDDCQYPSECLQGKTPNGSGRCSSCNVSSLCVDTCRARTPHGCDCFGCCQVFLPGGDSEFVELRESCSLAKIGDADACPRCIQNTQCRNTCDRCELCPGRTARDLPADCRDNDPALRCGDPLVTVCANSAECTTDQYCQLGCCFTLLL